MDFSFASLITTILFSTIAILLLSYLISGHRVVSKKGFAFLSFIIILIMIRLFLPFEFLSVQSNINITLGLPDIVRFFNQNIFVLIGREWNIFSLLLLLSLIGSIFFLIKLILSYFTTGNTLYNFRHLDHTSINRLLTEITAEYKKPVSFRIVTDKSITTPFIFGLFKPIIALPDMPLSEEEWYYILSHEVTHYYHKDLWLRFVCELLLAFYWWNPAVYLLRRQVKKLQEIRTDTVVSANLDEIQKLSYIQCLIKMTKLKTVRKKKWAVAFNDKNEITNRIKTLLNTDNRAHGRTIRTIQNSMAFILLIVFALFLPNFTIIKPNNSVPEEIAQTTAAINNTNSYFVLQEDGTYDVYVDGEYFGSVTQIFDDTIKIIDWKGNVIHEETNPRHLNNLFECTF